MEAINYRSTGNNTSKFLQTPDSDKKESEHGRSLNRSVAVVSESGSFIGANALPNQAAPVQRKRKYLTTGSIQATLSSNPFRAELEEIKAQLDAGIVKSVEDCKAQLTTIIENNVGVYRYRQDQNILFHIEKNDSVKTVKKLLDKIISSISSFTISNITSFIETDQCINRSNIELLLLICKHYRLDKPFSMLQNLLEDFDNSGNQSLREACRFLNIYEDIFKKNIPVYLMFDLLSDGHFTTSSRLYYVLGEKIERDIGADFPPHKRKLLFEFDNSINVQMIWALFSILNYWDTYYISFLNSFTEAIFDQHGIDLHEDEGLIKYLAMRMNNTDFEELKQLLAIAEDSGELLYEIELSEIFKVCKHMSSSEKPIYILKKFIRSKYFKGINDGLFDYLKKNLPNDYWTSHSDFVMLLQKSPVSSLSEVEECMDKIDKKLKREDED